MLEIRTNQLKTRKKVKIDNHEYTVRKMGNIERMDLSQHLRRIGQLAELENKKPLTETQQKEVDTINAKVPLMFVSLFDDGGDQSRSRALVAGLSETELGMLMAQIWDEETQEGQTSEAEEATDTES